MKPLAILSGLLLSSGASFGQVSFRYLVTGTVFEVAPGGLVTIPVYLQETASGTSTSLLLAETGVFSTGVKVARTGTLPSSPAGFFGAASVAPNTVQFHDQTNLVFGPVITISAAEAKLLEFARTSGVTGSPGVTTRTIFLGNFHIQGGTQTGQETTFQVTDYAPGTSDTVTWQNHIPIDSGPPGIQPATVTVRVVNVACYPNCDGTTSAPILSANDFQCYLTQFAAGNAYANCDGSTNAPLFTPNDFVCYVTRFAGGCQ